MKLPISSDSYIPRIKFTTDPNRLAVVTLNRTQNEMDIYSVNPKSGISKLLLRETDKSWIEESILDNISFYPDFFVIASSRSGYQHLFRYNYNGTLAKQITKGEWNVFGIFGL